MTIGRPKKTRYFATCDVTVNGTPWKEGQEILNMQPGNVESMLRTGLATAKLPDAEKTESETVKI